MQAAFPHPLPRQKELPHAYFIPHRRPPARRRHRPRRVRPLPKCRRPNHLHARRLHTANYLRNPPPVQTHTRYPRTARLPKQRQPRPLERQRFPKHHRPLPPQLQHQQQHPARQRRYPDRRKIVHFLQPIRLAVHQPRRQHDLHQPRRTRLRNQPRQPAPILPAAVFRKFFDYTCRAGCFFPPHHPPKPC